MTTNDSTTQKKPARKPRRTIADVEREAQKRIAQLEREADQRVNELQAQMAALQAQEEEVPVTLTLRSTKSKRERMKKTARVHGMSMQAAYDQGADMFLEAYEHQAPGQESRTISVNLNTALYEDLQAARDQIAAQMQQLDDSVADVD